MSDDYTSVRAVLIRVDRDLFQRMFMRDESGNRLTVDLGEPDADGVFCPTVTLHYEDNPLREIAKAVRDFRAALDSLPDLTQEVLR